MLNWLQFVSSKLFRVFKSTFHKKLSLFYVKAEAWYGQVQEINDETWLTIIVPIYNSKPEYLDALVDSFNQQEMDYVELIMVDDGSTDELTRKWLATKGNAVKSKLIRNKSNGGIVAATNIGLREANGTWVTFLDHDDVIAPFGLKAIYEAIINNIDAEFFYTDEIVTDDKLKPLTPYLKPAYDPVLLSGVNYINHFSIYKRKRLEKLKYLKEGLDGSQDYDMLLRYFEGLETEKIYHIPYPAYFWREVKTSYSHAYLDKALSNARQTIAENYPVSGYDISVVEAKNKNLHRVIYEPSTKKWAKIGIIIPNLNSLELISKTISDIYEKTDYPEFQVVVIDNGTDDVDVLSFYEEMRVQHDNFEALVEVRDFNFSHAVNLGFKHVNCDHYLLLNNDVEVIHPDWLKEMVSCLAYENVGIVGAKLLYANKTIQHAGVIIGVGGKASHWFFKCPSNYHGPMGRLHVRNSMTCVTGAVMLISGDCLDTVGLWDEQNFAVAYNDVDFCLRAHKAGFYIVWTPFAELFHHESVSRGSDKSLKNKRRFMKESNNLQRLHSTHNYVDKASNPFVNRRSNRYSFKIPDSKPSVRNEKDFLP